MAICPIGALAVATAAVMPRCASVRLPLDVLVTPLRQETAVAAIPWPIAQRPAVIVLTSDPETEIRSRIETLRERFGLTPAEATPSRLKSSKATAGKPPPTGSASPSGRRAATCPRFSTRPA